MRGLLLVLEGPDGSGKTAQSELLRLRLARAGIPVELHHEPTTGDVGLLIRQALRAEHLIPPRAMRMLFAADRADHNKRLHKILNSGTTVVCDRYDLSNAVSSWIDEPTMAELRWTRALEVGHIKANVTIVLRTPLDVCLARVAERGRPDNYDAQARLRCAHEAYEVLGGFIGGLDFVDGSGTKEEVAERVWAAVEKRIGEVA